MINENSLNIPKARSVHSSGEPLPFIFIGDKSFFEENMKVHIAVTNCHQSKEFTITDFLAPYRMCIFNSS